MKVITQGKIPIKSWCEDIENKVMEQAINLSNLPFTFKHIALMPDCHVGYGMPIGGVLATNGEIMPFCVGVDIGCGMSAVQTTVTDLNMDDIKRIMSDIRGMVPVGYKHNQKPTCWEGFDYAPKHIKVVSQELESATYQLGSLGGGNHFIEIQKGSDGFIWIMLHSGSRNIGYKIANVFHSIAKGYCESYYSNIPNTDLAFFPRMSDDNEMYLEAMKFALDFAKENRRIMMMHCKAAMKVHTGCVFEEEYNIHHNYAQMEHHFGKNVLIHRKGATRAYKGEYGIIPGSQGAKSYIVRGLGNPESFMSCSHGAGRVMGRKEAIRKLDFDAEVKHLDDRNIVHSIRNKNDLDEAPSAYKDIETVMANQDDLVEIVVELTPLGVIKG